jgi:hypothetical protein
MARTSSRTRTATRARPASAAVNPRTVFLASLGAAVIARREAERLAADAATVPQRLRAGADAAVDSARSEVKKLGKQIDAARTQGVAEAAKRLNPLLARVGLPKIAAKTPAKRGAKAATKRRPAATKAAKTARRA